MHTASRYLSGLGSFMLYMQMARVVSAYNVFWFALPHIPALSVLANRTSVQNGCTHVLLVLRCPSPATKESHHFRRLQTSQLPVHRHGQRHLLWLTDRAFRAPFSNTFRTPLLISQSQQGFVTNMEGALPISILAAFGQYRIRETRLTH